ncbi:MAG: CRISPR-associated helicase Cas3', partial [Planctomycetota bacterium]
MNFGDFFRRATQIIAPYPYQRAFAEDESLPELLSIPTGLGKTAAVVLGWLYRRRFHKNAEIRNSTPRRLVYCFPMRVLVEQTHDVTQGWLEKLGLTDDVKVHLLMGGVDGSDWDEYPESDSILIGTQDMLLSRALNRGYGMSRYRWPMHFGLLNNDSLWVMDETQLMGVGLTTTAQLQGLRKKLKTYGNARSLWMSATLDASPIKTVDHPEPQVGYARQTLTENDLKEKEVQKRIGAKKPLEQSKLILSAESEKKGYAKDLATAIKAVHESETGRLTLVVLNRVIRAQEVFTELEKLCGKTKSAVELALIHARFRPSDRRIQEDRLFKRELPAAGRIVIATQAIEAGVDVSATTLFTELAPWPSLVQRFGRCNRKGEFTDAKVIWIDTQPKDDKDKVLLPYERASLNQSREFLNTLNDVGPNSLKAIQQQFEKSCKSPVVYTLRRRDLLDLWDTTPDLAGNDLDVSRFIRDADDTDVQFYWRDLDDTLPTTAIPAPKRNELCAVAIGRAKDFLTKLKKNKSQFAGIWNPLLKKWLKLDPDDIRPGMVLLLRTELGGYLDRIGWTGDPADKPTPKPPPAD